MPDWPTPHAFACFAVIAVAASSIAACTRTYFKLPLITGYILAGILCGPHLLALLSSADCRALSAVINDDAMGFIGFSAGSKFLLSELSGSLRAVLSLLAGLVLTTFTLVCTGMHLAAPYLDLTKNASPIERSAMAVIIATLAVARSPSSAIALVSELDAHGPFTTAALSVTVLMDVIVVLLFALSLLFVHMLTPVPDREAQPPLQVLGLFGLQLIVSVALGLCLGWALHAFISLTNLGLTTAKAAPLKPADPKPADPKLVDPAPAELPPAPKEIRKGPAVSFAPLPQPAGAPPPSRELKKKWGSVVFAGLNGPLASKTASELAVVAAGIAPSKETRHCAALLGWLWVSIKVALVVAESVVMQVGMDGHARAHAGGAMRMHMQVGHAGEGLQGGLQGGAA